MLPNYAPRQSSARLGRCGSSMSRGRSAGGSCCCPPRRQSPPRSLGAGYSRSVESAAYPPHPCHLRRVTRCFARHLPNPRGSAGRERLCSSLSCGPPPLFAPRSHWHGQLHTDPVRKRHGPNTTQLLTAANCPQTRDLLRYRVGSGRPFAGFHTAASHAITPS